MKDTLKEHLRKIGSKGGKTGSLAQNKARAANAIKARAKVEKNKLNKVVDSEHAL